MSYDDFHAETGGNSEGQITSWSIVELPVRALDSPANLYVRLAGIADALRGDPYWEADRTRRGSLSITSDSILDIDDVLIGSCANAGFARIDHDDDSGDGGEFGMAVDDVPHVEISAGKCSMRIHIAYSGDSDIKTVSFSADLLIYRPSLVRP
jgi:hypothetical protein